MIGFFTGIAASMAHVITGPDHLAAVTPLAIDSRKKSWAVGISWGIGHTTGLLLLGGLFLLFRNLLPFDKISSHSELMVGIVLLAIGTWSILRTLSVLKPRHHAHPHVHTKPRVYVHIHDHSHVEGMQHDHVHPEGNHRQNIFTALFIGIIHGLAGFSHLLAVLPALALPTMAAAIYYLAGFAAGTVLTMALFASVLGIIAQRSSEKKKLRFLKGFSLAGGILAIIVGILWILKFF